MEMTADIMYGDYYRGYRQRESRAQNDRPKNEKPGHAVTFDTRFTGGGESVKPPYKSSTLEKQKQEHCRGANSSDASKLDYERRQEKNTPDVCRCQQSNLIFSAKKQRAQCAREQEERTDSSKSEEKAATTIQAVYRGYKTRRRFHEIRKSMSEEKRNIHKVAELLAIPMGETIRKPLVEPIRISSSLANQIRNEKEAVSWQSSPRRKNRDPVSRNQDQSCIENQLDQFEAGTQNQQNASMSIKTIKSPVFFSNYDEKISSLSENTDAEDPSPAASEPKSGTDFEDNVIVEGNVAKENDTNFAGEDTQQMKTNTKSVQIRESSYRRPLPQRISSSMLGSNSDGYFFDNSLFFPNRESVLVFGGVDPHEEYGRAGNSGKDIYRFKPDENVWEFVGEIPQARHHHSVAYLRGRIYVVGGADPLEDKLHRKNTAVASVWSYDPTTRTWFNEPSMLTARKDFGLVVSHGKMYAVGGQGWNGMALKTIEAFDPTDSTWREMQPMQTARVGPASVKYRDLIWVAGGMTKSKKELFSKDVECYDPIRNLWLKAASLRSPRCFASFYVVSDCLYVIGGASTTENGTQSIDSVDVWDINASVWKELANLSIARHGHSTGSIGDQLLIIGGVTTVFMKTLNSVECYCCDIGKWMKGVSALPHPISGHGTVSLPPANLLIDH